jgi:hypothetical protein
VLFFPRSTNIFIDRGATAVFIKQVLNNGLFILEYKAVNKLKITARILKKKLLLILILKYTAMHDVSWKCCCSTDLFLFGQEVTSTIKVSQNQKYFITLRN